MATEVDPVGENDPLARQGSPQEGTSNSIKEWMREPAGGGEGKSVLGLELGLTRG